jgi:predicted DNA-binding protein YlxM (UPF0122 family)
MTMLFDFYGELLTERQKEFFDLYYNEDLSLAEIAENNGITRQGVRDVIVRAEGVMQEIEDKTGLIRRFMAMKGDLDKIEQAAEELYDLCKPGRRNRISVTPMPRTITLNVSGNILFKPATAEVYIDGTFAGNAAESFALPEGKHSIEIKAAGYKSKKLDVNVSKDLTINVQLEK